MLAYPISIILVSKHASHVTMSGESTLIKNSALLCHRSHVFLFSTFFASTTVTKLLSRIVQPKFDDAGRETDKMLHDHTFGITSDPLTQFACVLSALVHDA